LLQYVDSIEVHQLIDKSGEVAICQQIESNYHILHRSLAKSPALLTQLAKLTQEAVQRQNIEDTIYLRESSDETQQASEPTDHLHKESPTSDAWIKQLHFHAQHLTYSANKGLSLKDLRKTVERHLNAAQIDIRVLKTLLRASDCNSTIRSAINKIESQRDALIHSNLRLVISVARQFKDRGMSYVDLIQEGNIGLIKAAVRFDYRKGFKFSTYAHWWIWQGIKLAIAKQRNTIRLPTHIHDQIAKLYAIKEHLRANYNREPDIEEIGKKMDLSAGAVEKLIQLSQDPLSLDMPVGESGESTFGASLIQDNNYAADIAADEAQLGKYIEKLLYCLSDREQKVLKMRYGIGLHDTFTLEQIAQQVGLTRERVRQIEKEALTKVQDNAHRSGKESF
jgi:RNA polymerase primary sigma factor